jgi:uncharacterized membrane protein
MLTAVCYAALAVVVLAVIGSALRDLFRGRSLW